MVSHPSQYHQVLFGEIPGHRLGLFVILFLALCLAPVAGSELSSSQAREVLRNFEERQKEGFTADFVERREGPGLSRPLEVEGILHVLPPERFQREVRRPSPSLTTSDGTTLWIHYPAFEETEIYDLTGQGRLDDLLRALTAGLTLSGLENDFEIQATAVNDGFQLNLRPLRAGMRRQIVLVRITLSPELDPVSIEVEARDGSRTVTELQNLRSLELDLSQFSFSPPEGGSISYPMGRPEP